MPPYKLNGKFVSKAVYEAAQAAESENVVSDEQTTDETPKTRKPRTVDPVTAATARVRKAERELERAKKAHAKVRALPDLDGAQAAYDEAVAELRAALHV